MVHHQEDGRLTTTAYPKPTHTDRYLSFSSHHPSMHKRAVVKSLTDRAAKIPTTKFDQIKEKQRIISTLQSNGYPKCFILDASKPKPPLNGVQHNSLRQRDLWANKESFGKPWHQSGIQILSDNKPDVSNTERPNGQRRDSWSCLRHYLRWLQQELHWRNAEKILNKKKRALKGCRAVRRRKISSCRPRDKNKSRYRMGWGYNA